SGNHSGESAGFLIRAHSIFDKGPILSPRNPVRHVNSSGPWSAMLAVNFQDDSSARWARTSCREHGRCRACNAESHKVPPAFAFLRAGFAVFPGREASGKASRPPYSSRGTPTADTGPGGRPTRAFVEG